MRIVIGSAGRRVYLVRWFKEALERAEIDGQVYVFENNSDAASVAVADEYRHMPRYESPKYNTELIRAVDDVRPHLYISLNDYELTNLASGNADKIRERGVVVPSLAQENHNTVADKYLMWQVLDRAGIPTPTTALLSDKESVECILSATENVIIKDRYGSASSGLLHVESGKLQRWMNSGQINPFEDSLDRSEGCELVVQPALSGQEYGLDIVTPLNGGPPAGVLARRKIAMRHGETNIAETVAPYDFVDLASELAKLLGSQGLIDVDVIRTDEGTQQVIDINPRFGGGYPFNHIAGADVPSYYVASVNGQDNAFDWCDYEFHHRSAKYEEIVDLEASGSRL